jgi:hypothetical protein
MGTRSRRLDISTIMSVIRSKSNTGDLENWTFNEPTNNIYNNNSGNVGINNTEPEYKLDVVGDLRVTSIVDSINSKGEPGQYLCSTGDSYVWAPGAGTQGSQGAEGPFGGPQGFQGWQGQGGFQGNNGNTGFRGFQGFQGEVGTQSLENVLIEKINNSSQEQLVQNNQLVDVEQLEISFIASKSGKVRYRVYGSIYNNDSKIFMGVRDENNEIKTKFSPVYIPSNKTTQFIYNSFTESGLTPGNTYTRKVSIINKSDINNINNFITIGHGCEYDTFENIQINCQETLLQVLEVN